MSAENKIISLIEHSEHVTPSNQELIDLIDLPRHKPENFYNYTEADLAEREVEVKRMGEIYPRIPAKWVEDIYDLLKNEPEKMDEIIKNMKEGIYDKK